METGSARRRDGHYRQMAGRLSHDRHSKLRTHESRRTSSGIPGRYKCELCTGCIYFWGDKTVQQCGCSCNRGCCASERWSTRPSPEEGGIQGLDLTYDTE